MNWMYLDGPVVRDLVAARDRVLENHCVGAFKVNRKEGRT